MEESVVMKLYDQMFRSRYFEEAVMKLWEEGHIYGEMHLGIGEEAIIAGIISQLVPGDAISTDHRSTPPFIMRGVDPNLLLLEMLGHKDGLCSGMGGHMHFFSKEHLLTSSGIVGSAGPSAVGFALASKYKKLKKIAVAFFGEGAMNQGMLLESMNLASALNLPVLFVCKDNGWAITTRSKDVTGGNLVDRAKGLGVKGTEIDGSDVMVVWEAVKAIMPYMRKKNRNPFFLQAKCVHKEGHFLGDPLLRFHKSPIKEFGEATGPLMKSVFSRRGVRPDKRVRGMENILSLIARARAQRKSKYDPLNVARKKLGISQDEVMNLESTIQSEIDVVIKNCINIYHQEVSL